MNCLNCGDPTSNPSYCSRSCSAVSNNKKYPKRSPEAICKDCGKSMRTTKRKSCDECYIPRKKVKDQTIAELKGDGNANNSGYTQIRADARKSFRSSGRPMTCQQCGYDLHVEICHIKDISSFSDDTYIFIINDLSNLVTLCPNHHWEFDNGVIPKNSFSEQS